MDSYLIYNSQLSFTNEYLFTWEMSGPTMFMDLDKHAMVNCMHLLMHL